MRRMTDLHCHILPDVDDGAGGMEVAVSMAQMAWDSGVGTIVATPHCNLPGEVRKNYISDSLARRYAEFQRVLRQQNIPLRVVPGGEVYWSEEVPALFQRGLLPTIADSRYLLVEFDFDILAGEIDRALNELSKQGVTPVVAHPERYSAVQRSPELIVPWFEKGYVIQLNKGTILGKMGRDSERTAEFILRHGLAHVVASDAHSASYRTPHMKEIYSYLETEYSPEYASVLLVENPHRIVFNQSLVPV